MRWLVWSLAFGALGACGPGVSGGSAVATECDPAAGASGGCPEGMRCLSSTFFGMTQAFCYPSDRARCGGTTCCPSGTGCYGPGFGVVENGSNYCFTAEEAARLCKHPHNHFVCSTTFGMLEPVPYSSSACPDSRSDAGPPPPRDASAMDVFVPAMDASTVMDTGVAPRDASAPMDTGVPPRDTGVPPRDTGVPQDAPSESDASDASAPTDAPVCTVTMSVRDCDTLMPCNPSTFMASCDDNKRLRYCEAAGGGTMATVRLQFCSGSDVCRACRGAECMPGYESVCAAP